MRVGRPGHHRRLPALARAALRGALLHDPYAFVREAAARALRGSRDPADLEALEHAQARGATILAEVLGGASTADAYHITAPHPEGDGAERAMRLALVDAGLEEKDVTYINAHGTGTDLNDRTEGLVVERIFGSKQPAVSSIKGTTGHGLGASGSIEAAIVVQSMIRGELLPNIGLENQDPEIPLTDIVVEVRDWTPAPTLSSSFGFGGHNTVLAFAPF